MALSYGLSLNLFLVLSVKFQCMLANTIISVERVEQYMHIPSEASKIIEEADLQKIGLLLAKWKYAI